MDPLKHFEAVVSSQLQKCESAEEMLHLLSIHYDLSKPLGLMSNLAFRQGLRSAIVMIKPAVK